MSAQASAPATVDLFKKVYGNTRDLTPKDFPLERDIPWANGQKVGDSYVEAVVLTNEVGITLGGTGTDAFEINPAIAGAVKQASVQPSVTVLPSIIPWAVISRSNGGGEKAFFDATKQIVKNNLRSHGKFHEIFRWYGQATGKLGAVSYATATYRGASFTNGAGTLVSTPFGSLTFTAGVTSSGNVGYVLFGPGTFAAGHWVGMKGVQIVQIASASGAVVAQGSMTGMDATLGIIQTDFVPVAATSATSHYIGIKGQDTAQEMMGVQAILNTAGTLFSIPNKQYELFRGNVVPVGSLRLTLSRITTGIANAVNQGELEGDIDLYVNPRSWGTIASDEAALRKYDAHYDENEATNGFKNVTYFSQSGKVTIKAHSSIKEGDAAGMMLDTWSRSGSAEVSFKVPGVPDEIIFPLQNQAGQAFRSYADQYIFCFRPSWNLWFSGINDESAT